MLTFDNKKAGKWNSFWTRGQLLSAPPPPGWPSAGGGLWRDDRQLLPGPRVTLLTSTWAGQHCATPGPYKYPAPQVSSQSASGPPADNTSSSSASWWRCSGEGCLVYLQSPGVIHPSNVLSITGTSIIIIYGLYYSLPQRSRYSQCVVLRLLTGFNGSFWSKQNHRVKRYLLSIKLFRNLHPPILSFGEFLPGYVALSHHQVEFIKNCRNIAVLNSKQLHCLPPLRSLCSGVLELVLCGHFHD